MNSTEIHKYLISKSRNIYQEADLFHQNRRPIESYLDLLACPTNGNDQLIISESKLVTKQGLEYNIKDDVVDFRYTNTKQNLIDLEWKRLNQFLINYQRYLTPYTLINSLPIYSYIAEKTGLNKLKDARIIDVGGGTGQIFGTFFYHQESLEYFLLDPNLRLLHDQFLRLYPKLASFPIGHLLSYAENLPFKSSIADLVMSISSIDHFKDYKLFISESRRVLKDGGLILIASHLDVDSKTVFNGNPSELLKEFEGRSFSQKVYNRLALKYEYLSRKYHNKKRGTVEDDHTHSFENTLTIEAELQNQGFVVLQSEIFNRNFFVFAKKV